MISSSTNRGWWSVLVILLTALMGGCGGSEPATIAAAEPAPTPYATADELPEHINDLLSRDPIDVDGLERLYHTENDLQRRLLRSSASLRGIDELAHRVHQRYGEGLLKVADYSPLAPLPPATIIDRTHPRALARTFRPDETPYDLYLVQIGDRWWISGYTLERIFESPNLAQAIAEKDFSNASERARTFMARVDRGEFETIEEVRKAWLKFAFEE